MATGFAADSTSTQRVSRDPLFGLARTHVTEVRLALFWVGTAALTAAAAGYFLSRDAAGLAVAVAALPMLAWLVARPTSLLVPLAVSIPATQSLTGGGSHSVSLSDMLLVLIAGGILLQGAVRGTTPAIGALRPVALPVLQFCWVVVLLLPFHVGIEELLQTAQRLELFLLPLAVGAFAALTGWHTRMLGWYVLSGTALALVWQFDSLGLQKNPAGQFIANAILIVVGVPALRRFFPCLLVLVPGLFLTESRGAIVATAIGLAVLLVIQASRTRMLLTRALPVVGVAAVAFALLPPSVQERVTTFSAGTDTPAAYAISIREEQAEDARRIIAEHPWTGVGIGNYYAGDPAKGTQADDPHQVLLLQAAEGGYVLAASFVVLVLGACFALGRMRRLDIAPAAAAVLFATAAHGLVDIYWVRGTPVLGWLLVGMACGVLARQRRSG